MIPHHVAQVPVTVTTVPPLVCVILTFVQVFADVSTATGLLLLFTVLALALQSFLLWRHTGRIEAASRHPASGDNPD